METLARTPSIESSHSRSNSNVLSLSSAASASSRKARSAEPDISNSDHGISERASISMPPPASKTMQRQYHPPRRPSKASDSQLTALNAIQAESGNTIATGGSAIVDAAEHGILGQIQTGDRLPDSPNQLLKPSEGDLDSNRMSFSSLYSLGSVIYNGARSLAASYPSSVAGSEPEGEQSHSTRGFGFY